MAAAVASPPPMRSLSAIAPEIVRLATCPLCHTVDPTMTNIALSAGVDWHCSRCGQRWDTMRLAAVAGYAMWLSARTRPTSMQQLQEVTRVSEPVRQHQDD